MLTFVCKSNKGDGSRSSFAHPAPLISKYHLLTLDNIHLLQVALFMFSTPSTFQTTFNKNFETHQYATRQANEYKADFRRINILKFYIVSSDPRLWNSFSNDLKSKQSLACFKKNLKRYLVNLNNSITHIQPCLFI